MVHYIENEHLKVGVKEFGCELTSIKSKATGFEYLWQGDEKFWTGQSPILFLSWADLLMTDIPLTVWNMKCPSTALQESSSGTFSKTAELQ